MSGLSPLIDAQEVVMRRLLTSLLCMLIGLTGCMPGNAPAPPAATLPASPTASATAPPTITPAGITLAPSSTPLPSSTPVPFGYVSTIVAAVNATKAVVDETRIADNLSINPLTGKRADNPLLLERRPLAIKITNFPRSVRPQWGLNSADHIWEYYLEDELTRFVGVFYGNDAERVGPVRSARPFDEHLLHMYKAILTFAYADKRLMDQWVADKAISPFMVIQKPDNCPPMCRIGTAENDYNNLFTNTAQLSAYVSERGTSNGRQNLEGLVFGPAGGGGESVHRLDIRFSPESYLYWQYDPILGRYLRWQDTERQPLGQETYTPLMDSLGNQQVAADNIILLMLPEEYVYVSRSTDVITHRLEGGGTGFAARDGRLVPINWTRAAPESMLQLTLANGQPYLLKPGNVWFEALSDLTQVVPGAEAWKFIFDIPPVPTITPKYTPTPTLYPLNP